MIYVAPELTRHDKDVLAEIHEMRRELAAVLRSPRRWTGGLRKTMLARAILGSCKALEIHSSGLMQAFCAACIT